ncbi:MAG: DNA-binding protein HU-beta [candidate division WWE3 bacterium GW2011_GWA1_46_21]|uniref:DNA-binding protein HU-beta n=3 Tax=Katanobacteria TaxID=422282 RepID=A0A0G1RIQ2_UNCKA|nr:MAG: DNA-binding protein HU-beta [candidate division WWE3 bacterium GW2011_GWA1_46_21]KKU48488.1 MAG: DNA-binding protein HU-beta [candidate division WWE3 bacterium GW2011_GWA2_46_9]KKU57088.1 MAG: DNA-binding protein HU-beta [candidate division WWE3 bacterium GW2011_GWB1_47_11]
MTKADLVAAVANVAGLTKVAADQAVDAVADSVTKALSRGEKVTWTGFGTFEVRSRAARMGRNPQTGAPMHIPAGKTPAFKAGKGLKDAVK